MNASYLVLYFLYLSADMQVVLRTIHSFA